MALLQLNLLIQRRLRITLHLWPRIPHRKLRRTEIILRHARIQAPASRTVRAMTADMAVVAAGEAVTAVEIAEAGSVVEAAEIAEAVRRAAICRHRNMHRHPGRRARRLRRIHRRDHLLRVIARATLRRQPKICRRLFCPVNRSRNIASVLR
jgi:hypothetical protein